MEREWGTDASRTFQRKTCSKSPSRYIRSYGNLPKLSYQKPKTLEKILDNYIAFNTVIPNGEMQPSSLNSTHSYIHNSRVAAYRISK